MWANIEQKLHPGTGKQNINSEVISSSPRTILAPHVWEHYNILETGKCLVSILLLDSVCVLVQKFFLCFTTDSLHADGTSYKIVKSVASVDNFPAIITCEEQKNSVCICTTSLPGHCDRNYYILNSGTACRWEDIAMNNKTAVNTFHCRWQRLCVLTTENT